MRTAAATAAGWQATRCGGWMPCWVSCTFSSCRATPPHLHITCTCVPHPSLPPSPVKVPRDPATGRPAAYVALHGHGVYPQPARHLRHFFLGNDLCSAAGLTWRPRRVLLLPGATATEASADIGELEDEGQAASRGDGASPAAAAATAADPTYCLPHVPSRGSLLAGVSSYSNSDAGGGAGVRRASGSATGAVATYSESGSGTHGLPQVVTDNPCAWVWFRGDWGTTPAPIEQAWMHRAEPPISRSLLLRIFGHFWPEPR